VKKSGGANQAGLASTPVDFASNCAGDAALCSGSTMRPPSLRAVEAAFQPGPYADDET
jgi:hypothetical protein